MILALLALSLLSAPVQEADTLSASEVSAVSAKPVIRPAETVLLHSETASSGLAEIINRFTSVQVKDYGGAGGLKTINVRSLGSEHVGVFLDGIQIDNAQNMQVDLGRFSTDALEGVALYNGQKSVRLQTAKEYASGAALYLYSGKPSRSGGRLRMRGGSFLTLNPSARLDFNLSGNLSLRTEAEFLSSSGRYRFPWYDTTLVRENGDIRSLRLQAGLYGRQWQLQAYTYGSERGFPGPVLRRAAGFPFSAERQADQDIFVQGSWLRQWNGRYTSALRGKYTNNYTHYDSHPEKNPMAMPYNLHYRQQSGYLSLAQSYMLAPEWSADLSTDLQYNTLDSDTPQFVEPSRLTLTGALSSTLILEKFQAAAHIVYTGAFDHYDNPQVGGWSRENGYRDAWTPSISLSWTPLPWFEASAFAKQSYRLPSFNDLYYTLIGNSGLEPEKATQAGLDLRSEGPFWSLRLSPYLNRVNEKIVAIPTASQFRWSMMNIGIVDITGLDARVQGRWTPGEWKLLLTLRYSLQQARDHSNPDSQFYGNQIPYIPLHSGGAEFRLERGRWSFLWSSSFSGEKWSRTANIPDYYIEAWTLSDAALYFRTERFTAGLRCNNIFNTKYQIVQGYPMPGTNAMLSLEYKW